MLFSGGENFNFLSVFFNNLYVRHRKRENMQSQSKCKKKGLCISGGCKYGNL